MIPLIYFLFAWLTLLAIFGIMMLITLMTMLRYSLAGFLTYASTTVFVLIALFVTFLSGAYLVRVDWNQRFGLSAAAPSELPLTP